MEVIEEALALLDEVGLDALTTRALAARLGVRASALYRHVSGKKELLAALADRIMSEALADPPQDADWAGQLESFAHRLRRSLLAHRDAARVVAQYGPLGERALLNAEAGIGLLRSAGLPLSTAAHAGHTVVCFVVGFVLQEQAPTPEPDGQRADFVRGNLPHLTEWLADRPDEDASFAIGLRILVNGLRVELS
jgi:TetR/AcrR family tetracycline transcriptional repressor